MTKQRTKQFLIREAQEGNRSAFQELVAGQRARLELLVHKRLGVHLRERVEIEDILQETLLRAYQSVQRFEWRGEDSFLRWLGGIAENVILELARQKNRRKETQAECDPVKHDQSPSRIQRRHERFDRLQEAIDSLKPDYRKVILLTRVEGLSIEEVAKRMNRSPNAISHLLLRALAKLGEVFGDTESFSLPDRMLRREGDEDGK